MWGPPGGGTDLVPRVSDGFDCSLVFSREQFWWLGLSPSHVGINLLGFDLFLGNASGLKFPNDTTS